MIWDVGDVIGDEDIELLHGETHCSPRGFYSF